MNIITLSSREALAAAAAERIGAALRDGVATHGTACAALSGGSAEAIYRALAAQPMDWTRITFALVDERFVPPAHEASNQRLIERALAPAFAGGARLEPLYSNAPSAAAAADRAEPRYAALGFDIAVMGMGEDGHTASWFPGAHGVNDALDLNSPRSVVALTAEQAQGAPERLTLTRAALKRARRLLLVISGENKRAVLDDAAAQGLPVAALFAPQLKPIEVLWAA